LAAGFSLALGFDAAAAVPDVVVSIKPLHSLAARIMAGVGEPTLLVGGNASLHSYSLKPSQAAALQEAELVLWTGPVLETFLEQPLEALAGDARIIEAMAVPGMVLLPPREGGAWEEEEEHDHEGTVDGHLFLDPANAKTLAGALVTALSELDPDNAAAYAANGAALHDELQALDRELATTLAPVEGKAFVVFHDAYQYFEARYRLHAIGSITVSPDRQPGARRLAELRDKLTSLGVLCVFAEPGFEPALLETLVEGTGVRTGVLDPEGTALAAGPGLYAELLRALAQSLSDCLS
jgi:zinc transport system substrate-binding protein